jgi:cob(I)alamin adenosyltransferase
MKRLNKGLVQVYTGNGKGKTTAAMGLALRAAGTGLRVYVCQFMKARPCGEMKAIKNIRNIGFDRCGSRCFIKGAPARKDIKRIGAGFESARKIVMSGKYDLVILDEANIASDMGLIDPLDIVKLIDEKPGHVEIVLTGRSCPEVIIKHADLVTEMKEVKHPLGRGVIARCGIEY